jgi:uncharacterized protein involved in outer membrane biogenesis
MVITLSPLTKKISLAMAVIFFIFAAGLFYVNKILLPIQVKGMAIKAASDALKRDVTFDALQYSPLRGFVVTGLVVAEKDDPSRAFIRAKSASAQILFFALLQKKLIIPSVRIESPEITLTRTGKDQWNFSDLLGAPTTGQPPMPMIISGFTITSGRVILNDTALGENFSEAVDLPLIKGSLSLQGAFHIAGDIAMPATEGTLKFETRIGLRDNSFKGTFKAQNIGVHRYLRFSPSGLPVDIQNLIIANGNITAIIQGKNTSLSGDITLPSLNITLADGTKLQGDVTLTKMTAGMNNADISVQGSLSAAKVAVETTPGLRATINAISAPNAQAATKEGKLTASGAIDARGIDLILNAEQRLKADVNVQELTITQDAKGYAVNGEIKADDLSITIGRNQTISGQAILRKMTALITGSAIQVHADLDIKNAAVDLPGTSIKTEILAPETRLTFDTGRLETELHAALKDLSVKAGNIATSGSPKLMAHLVFDPKAEIPLSYTGTLKLAGLNVSGLPTVNEIKDIRGEITFKTDSAATNDLAFTMLDTPMNVNGEISDFKKAKINAHAKINKADLGLLEKLIPDIVKEQGLTIKGSAAVEISFSGPLAQAQEGTIIASAKLTDAAVESKKLNQNASSINGLVEYKSPVLSWKDLSVNYQGKTWLSHGSLQDFLTPIVSATIQTDNLTADIEAKKKDDKIQLTSLSGNYFESTYELIGDIFLPTGRPPTIDMNGEFKLSLRDLPKMLPSEQAKQIEALKLAGILKIKTRVKGAPQDWQNLTSTTSVETPAFYMMGYQIADLAVNAKQKDGEVNPLTVSGKLYGGDLNATTTISLKEKKFPFTTGARLENTDLELLKKDTPLKQQQLSGLVNMTADLKGDLLDIRNMQGTATLKIVNGYLWSLEILSKVLSILSSTFQGGDVIITDADATFKITDQKVMTDNLTLRSATVTLVAEGWVDLDQNIEMNISPRIEPKTTDGTINPLMMINPTDGLVNIRVYNTLSAPKFEHNISAPKMIKKTLQNTVGSLLKMFE